MWAQVINTVLGLWLMAAPGIFDYNGIAADNAHIIGPVIVTFSFTALWECTRVMRKYNIPLAVWLLLAPWMLGYENTAAIASDISTGILVISFSLVKGKIEKRYGGGWSAIWKSNTLHEQEAKNK